MAMHRQLLLCILFGVSSTALSQNASELVATGKKLADLMNASLDETDELALSVGRVYDLATVPSAGVEATGCVLDRFAELAPSVDVLSIFPLPAISAPAAVLKSVLDTGKSGMLGLNASLTSVVEAFKTVSDLVELARKKLAAIAHVFRENGFITTFSIALDQLATLDTKLQESGDLDAQLKLDEAAAGVQEALDTMSGLWTAYKDTLTSLRHNVTSALVTVAAAVLPVQTLSSNISGTCEKVAGIAAPLSVLNAELMRERCLEFQGLCLSAMCASINDAFKLAPSQQLQQLLDPIIKNLMNRFQLDKMLDGLVVPPGLLPQVDMTLFPNITIPEMPKLPMLEIAPVETDIVSIANGSVSLISFKYVSLASLIDNCVQSGCGLQDSEMTTTTTTTDVFTLPPEECQLPNISWPPWGPKASTTSSEPNGTAILISHGLHLAPCGFLVLLLFTLFS